MRCLACIVLAASTVAPTQLHDLDRTHAPATRPISLALADLDGDQDLDALLVTDSAADTLLLNDGSDRFTDAGTRLPAASAVRQIELQAQRRFASPGQVALPLLAQQGALRTRHALTETVPP